MRNFPTAVFGISSTNSYRSGSQNFAKPGCEVRAELVVGRRRAFAKNAHGERALGPLLVRDRDHGRLGDRGMAHQRVLEGDRRDPLAARLDEVLRAVLDLDVPVGPDRDDVARPEPAVVRPAVGGVGRLVVGGRDRRAAHLELAHRLAVPRDEALLAARTDLDEGDRRALLGALVVRGGSLEAYLLADRARHRPDRAHLRHAPAVRDVEAVPLGERLDHRPRRRCAANGHRPHPREVPALRVRVEGLEDPHPDRRHAGADRHPLLDERVEQALRVEMRPREHLLGADERAREREAPCVRVEHRDDRQHGVALVGAEEPGGGQRVDRDRAVRVDDALRQPGGPAREAHRRGSALVDVAVDELALVGRGDQLLVVDRAVRRLARTDRDHVLEPHPVDELRGEGPEDLVDHEHAVACMGGDVGVVVRMEAEVQRVGDESAHRRADVGLEVLVVVPHERPDAVAVVQSEPPQRDREALGARRELRVAVPVPALVGQPGDDLAVAVELVAPSQDRGDVELVVHHQALHHAPPPSTIEQMTGDLRAELPRGRLPGLDAERALVEPVQHVLPGEADPAVCLDRPLARGDGGVRCLGFRGGRGLRRLGRRRWRRTTPPTRRASALARGRRTTSRAGGRPPGRSRSPDRTARASSCTRSPARARAPRRPRPRARGSRASANGGPAGCPTSRERGPARRPTRRRAAATRRWSPASLARSPRARRSCRRRRRRRASRCRGRERAGRARASSSSRRRPPPPGPSPRGTARGTTVDQNGACSRRDLPPRGARPLRRTRGPRLRAPQGRRRLSSRARRAAPRSARAFPTETRGPVRGARPAAG